MQNENTESQRCTECGRSCPPELLRTIDGLKVCMACLCGPVEAVKIYPIGVVVNNKERRACGFGTTGGDVSTLVLHSGQERFMTGLAEETHLLVVWQFHRQRPLRTLFARGWDKKRVGPFASRTPDRLTPIAVTEVELLEVDGPRLKVRGLEAVNGTPVLDIKVATKSLKGSKTNGTSALGKQRKAR